MGGDISIVRAARVSHDAAWRAGRDQGSDEKLIRYLWKNQHTTPFEAVTFTFEVVAPIFVLRQWMRHRTWTFNELSGRYQELEEKYYVPDPNFIGVQSKKNKQGRTFGSDSNLDVPVIMEVANAMAFKVYKKLLARGVPRELSRIVLPVATYSHMFCTVNLLNLLKFLALRAAEDAQYEIRVYADALRALVKPIVPVAMAAWKGAHE
jgi:thymidylate synthase (FAD)